MKSIFEYSKKKRKTQYYNRTASSYEEFGLSLKDMTEKLLKPDQTLILVCIGSDKITGDCLGPLVGHKLSRIVPHPERVYGTLGHPVHAQNLHEILNEINQTYSRPFLIAVDASLGLSNHIGYITLTEGPLKPGEGVKKRLPSLGEISITGIVNSSHERGNDLLHNTRLHLVEELADFIFMGMINGLHSFMS